MSKENTAFKLLQFWIPTTERFGLVLQGGETVELKNHSRNPSETALIAQSDIDAWGDKTVATWHTHPKDNVNLSATDYQMFLGLPHLQHYIVASKRVRLFVVRNNKVMLHEADCV